MYLNLTFVKYSCLYYAHPFVNNFVDNYEADVDKCKSLKNYPQILVFILIISSRICTSWVASSVIFSTACMTVV